MADAPQIISRADARAQGLKHYFTGKPCSRGHAAPRRVTNTHCLTCNRERSTEWSRNNQDRRHQSYLENRASQLAKCKARYVQNSDRVKARASAYYYTNQEAVAKKHASYRSRNRTEQRVRANAHYNGNKSQYTKRARAREQHIAIITFAHERVAIEEFYRNRPSGHHVDHVIPLKHPLVSGLHCIANLQYLPATENIEKGNRFVPEEHAA